MKILMRNIGMCLHVVHKLRARGARQRPGQHGLAAPADERRAPARVRRAARLRGAARPPARQLGLGHVRRRQHGRRHRVHGDARAGARASPLRLRLRRRAARVRPLPVHRGPGRRRAALGAAVALHRLGRRRRSTTRRCARRSTARTRCARTSSSTRRSARELRVRRRDASASTSAPPAVKGLAIDPDGRRARARAEAGYPLSTPRPGWAEQDPEDWWQRDAGGAGAAARRGRVRRGHRALAGRCTASSRSTPPTGCCAPRSSGTTSGRPPSARRSRQRSGSSG